MYTYICVTFTCSGHNLLCTLKRCDIYLSRKSVCCVPHTGVIFTCPRPLHRCYVYLSRRSICLMLPHTGVIFTCAEHQSVCCRPNTGVTFTCQGPLHRCDFYLSRRSICLLSVVWRFCSSSLSPSSLGEYSWFQGWFWRWYFIISDPLGDRM